MSSVTKETKDKDGEREKKRRRTIKTDIASHSPTAGPTIKKIIKVEQKSLTAATTKAIYAAEEAEVDSRDPVDDLNKQKKACEEVRSMMTKISQLREQGAKPSEIEEARIHGMMQFVTIKKLNRLAQIRCRKSRDATSEAKQKIDHQHLQLQNLLYEVTHLQKEITKCLEFKSKDEDINLVTVEEFYKDAPADISKPDVTKNDEHQQKLARLDWELEQRKRLAKKLGEVSGSKDALAQESKTKREYLESLQPKLNNILAATKPVQDHMGMPFDEIRDQHRTARYLPRPLYVLYMQASAFKDACDKDLTVSIHGDIDVAKALGNQTEDVEEDSDSDQEEEGKRTSKRRRKRAEDRKTQRKKKMLKKHPLTVVLDVKCKDGSVLHLTFAYLIALGICTVTVKLTPGSEMIFTSVSGGDLMSPESILTCLYPDDLGMDTPNPSNNYALNRLGLGDFKVYLSEVGRPYDWVQHVAGMQFLRVQPDAEVGSEVKTSISASCMEDTIRRLRARVRARQALQKQLAALERGSIPISSDDMQLFPTKVSSKLTNWKRTTYEDFKALPYTAQMIQEGIPREWDMYFVGTMERGSAKLTFHMVVSSDYPTSSPVFAIDINWRHHRNNLNDEHVKDMEAEVNIHYNELLKSTQSHDQLLSNQLQRLLMCFDVYLDTESENSAVEGPTEFSKDKIYPRFTRGPGRGKPYVYQYKMGFFSQR